MKNCLKCYLRSVKLVDAELLYKWRNEVDVRRNSFNSNRIFFEEHLNWLEKILQDSMRQFYILMYKDKEIGQVRIDIEDNIGVINYSIDSKYRGMGYGKIILRLVEEEILKNNNTLIKLVGYVKQDNIASQHIFQTLNYKGELKDDVYIYIKSLSN